jgi:hypothetical protein
MDERGETLARLLNPGVLDDGESVAFTIETVNGRRYPLNCPLPEIGDIFSFLGALAKAAGEERNVPAPRGTATYNYLAPIPASGMGFQAGRTPDETLVVIRLSGFDMAFVFPSDELVRLAGDIARIARTLSAGSGRPQ